MAANDWRFAAGADSGMPRKWPGQQRGCRWQLRRELQLSGYLQLEHGILLLPNAKFEMSDFSSSGGSFNNDLLAYDLSLYYRLFNNDLFQIDLSDRSSLRR